MPAFCDWAEASVLHVRCSVGYILNALNPKEGVGIDESGEQIAIAKKNYSHLTFLNYHSEDPALRQALPSRQFDFIVVNSVEEIVDIKAALDNLKYFCAPHTRIIIVHYNYLWHPWSLAERLNLKVPQKTA